jgi:hypothetical protein
MCKELFYIAAGGKLIAALPKEFCENREIIQPIRSKQLKFKRE